MATRTSPRRAAAKSRIPEDEAEEHREEEEEEETAHAPPRKRGRARASALSVEEDGEAAAADEGAEEGARKSHGPLLQLEDMDRYDRDTVLHARETNRRNCQIEAPVPAICKELPCMLGIDEAGRGPVCGPMVYGIALCPITKLDALKKLGFADSKTLNLEQRERLFKVIKASEAFLGWMVTVLSPAEISHGMLGRQNYNLNALSHDTAIALIRRCIDAGVNVAEVCV
jgi:hypothetical protein